MKNTPSVTIEAVPLDPFFGPRWVIRRADGECTHPTGDLNWLQWQVSKFGVSQEGAGLHVAIRRTKAGQPWIKTGTVMGTCLSDARAQAWMHGLTSSFFGLEERLDRVVRELDWIELQTKQHLKQVGIKARR